MFKVLIECETGTTRLTDGTAGCYWERLRHVITWALYDTWAEADRVATDITLGGKRAVAWVEFA